MAKNKILTNPAEIRIFNIVDMGLTFSAMIRLYEKGSKEIIHRKITKILPDIDQVQSSDSFMGVHEKFCLWATGTLLLAEKKRDGRIIKHSQPPSHGQVAKTLDVVLKVLIYYGRWPTESKAKKIEKFINAAVDTKMMKFLRSNYPDDLLTWPVTVGDVDQEAYFLLQKLVLRFCKQKTSRNRRGYSV